MIASWISYLPHVAVLFAVVYVPGFLSLRMLRLSPAAAVNGAPAVTYAIVGLASIVAGCVNVSWGWPVLVSATAIAAAAAWPLQPLMPCAERGRHATTDVPPKIATARRLSIALTLVFLIVPILWLADPLAPSVQADPMFHYNTVDAVLKTGDASMFTAIAPSYGISAQPTIYPTVWHAIVALLGEQSLMPVSHLLAYVVVPTVWVFGVDYLTRQLFPRRPRVWVAAPPTIAILPYFPNFLTVSRGFWPNSLALAAVPAVAGLAVAGLRVLRATPAGKPLAQTTLGGIAVCGAALLGLGLAHPGAVFALLWPVALPLAVRAAMALITMVRSRTYTREDLFAVGEDLFAVGGAGVFTVLVLALFASRKVRDFFGRANPRSWDLGERLSTLGDELSGFSPAVVVAGAALGVVVIAAFAVVVVQVWRMPMGRWLVLAWIAQWLALVGAYVDSSVFSALAGIWYHDPKRIMAILSLLTGLILAAWIGRKPFKLNPSLVVSLGAAAAIAVGGGLRAGNVYQDAMPAIGSKHPIDSRAELDVLRGLANVLPPGSPVLGDPTTGIGYAPTYSDVAVVFPQVNFHPNDVDGQYLILNFRDIHEDPHVCTILTEYGIGYYYEDDPLVYQKRDRSETWPGLYGVDTSRGFTKIAESDGGTLWRIDACGPIPESDWWDLSARTGFLPKN